MPQLDKLTFLPILFGTTLLYIGGFLLVHSTTLYLFLTALRLSHKRSIEKFLSSVISRRLIGRTLLFPWIAL